MSSSKPEICVVGTTYFHTGIGQHTQALCELLSEFANVCVLPLNPTQGSFVQLPSGKKIPFYRGDETIKVTFYCGILWNYANDVNVQRMPQSDLYYALIAYDSDTTPKKWVDILNSRFDGVFCVNKNLEANLKKSGVTIPIGTLPLGLNLSPLLRRKYKKPFKNEIIFGCVTSFHPRKNNDLLIKAFANVHEKVPNTKLIIHSNLKWGQEFEKCQTIVRQLNLEDSVTLSCSNKTAEELLNLLDSFDVFVNCSRGEGFSIPPREAAALGKVLVLSGLPVHRDFENVPGAFIVPAVIPYPCIYPEIEGLLSGVQYSVSESGVYDRMISAINYIQSDNSGADVLYRRVFASQWDYKEVFPWYLAAINLASAQFKYDLKSDEGIGHIPGALVDITSSKIGKFASKLNRSGKIVVAAHDGGFFSIFNVFMSHLVWSAGDPSTTVVLPDWDVVRLKERMKEKNIVSFCYGKPTDGNIFLNFFETLPYVTEQELQDEKFLYEGAKVLTESDEYFNVEKEPLLTYINAAALYKSQDFKFFRRRYNKVLKKYIRLRPELREKIDSFCEQFKGKFVIAAHVRHPSHAIEQKSGKMPTPKDYIDRINEIIEERGCKDWIIFLATDQDRTINIFKREFGENVVFYKDVRRLTDDEDKDFDKLPEHGKAVEGYQLQHKVAKNEENWNTSMAEEVICDAWTMAQSDVLLHVTSNVSTAVAYIGPETEFISMQPN